LLKRLKREGEVGAVMAALVLQGKGTDRTMRRTLGSILRTPTH
jgi:hypothetical protein